MKKTLGFFFDATGTGNWNWMEFLNGNVGMSGTDGQFLLLVNDLSDFYNVYFFTNVENTGFEKFKTLKVNSLEEAAIRGKELEIDLFIFNNRNDIGTVKGITKLTALNQPFILWDQNGPDPSFDNILKNNRSLKRIVCVSREHANAHRHKKYFAKVTYIYNAKDYAFFEGTNSNNKKAPHIGYLGALDESKGFQWVAKAWSKVKQRFPQATLTVMGSIKTHSQTRLTGDLGVADPAFENNFIKPYLGNTHSEIEIKGVKFTGHISPNEMSRLMQEMQIGIVNPNTGGFFTETFCVSALDFQGHNIPVIGANAGGLKETVNNGKTGLLLNDSNDLADTLIKILSDRDRLIYLRQNCANWVTQNFSRTKILNNWKNMITDVLNNRPNEIVKIHMADFSIKAIIKELVRIKNSIFSMQ